LLGWVYMSLPLFIDFDGTLFDTKALKKELDALFFEFGADKKAHSETYQPMRESGLYEPLDHAKLIWKTIPAGFEAAVEALLANAERFTFPDAKRFLQSLSGPYTLKILTQGSAHYQHQKITASGLGHFFDEILTCEAQKWEIIEQHVGKNQPFLLVEDRTDTIVMIAATHPKSYGIVIDRHNREPKNSFPLFQIVESFDKLLPLPARFPQLLLNH
jgi:FMN phosphatase YigB (HAD superfamily)